MTRRWCSDCFEEWFDPYNANRSLYEGDVLIIVAPEECELCPTWDLEESVN